MYFQLFSAVVADLTASEEDLTLESTQLFDAYDSPRVIYDERSKTYHLDAKVPYKLHGNAEHRANMFKQRLLFTQQRLLRSKMFSLRGSSTNRNSSSSSGNAGSGDGGVKTHELSTIESLLGSVGTKVHLKFSQSLIHPYTNSSSF